jgi:hypothetical protein
LWAQNRKSTGFCQLLRDLRVYPYQVSQCALQLAPFSTAYCLNGIASALQNLTHRYWLPALALAWKSAAKPISLT